MKCFFHKSKNAQIHLLLIITMEINVPISEKTVDKLPAKYEKFIMFSYWMSEQFKNSENPNLETMAHVFGSVSEQMEFIDGFLEDYKIICKNYKKDVRDRIKAAKPPPPPKEPKEQKKRGRKKKEVVDTRTDEEKLMDEIIANAQSSMV